MRYGTLCRVSAFWNWIQDIPDHLLSLDPMWLLLTCALLVFAEDAIFVGFVIPGETAAVMAGVGASLGHVSLALAIVVVVAAAILGDTVGFEVGKKFFGPKVLNFGPLKRHAEQIEAARAMLRRRGGVAVFLGRFTAFFRAMMPALAGAAHMPYRKFLAWNATGGIVWGTLFVVLGHAAGSSYQTLEDKAGKYVAIALAVIVVGLIVVWRVRSERAKKRAERPELPQA